MADLTYIQQRQEVSITGQDATGDQVNYVGADANGNMTTKDYSDGPVTPGTVAQTSMLIGGQYNSALPSPTTGQQSAIQLDYKGRLITAPASYSYLHPIFTTRVQSASKFTSTNVTTLATTISATTAGNLIIVCATSGLSTLTCTDSASQTYTTAVTVNNGGGNPEYNYTFYKANTAAGVTSVTITDGSATSLNMVVMEYSNITTSSPLDKTQSNSGAASLTFTSNSTTTTAQANELLIGACFDTAHNNTTFTAGTNWTAIATVQNGAGGGGTLFSEEQYVAATGTYAATGTLSQSDAYLATIATFKISSYPTNFVIPNTAYVIKSGPGTLANVAISTLGTNSASVTFYDGTSAAGTVIAVLSLTTSIGSVPYNLYFTNGLTMVVNSKTADFTVVYD